MRSKALKKIDIKDPKTITPWVTDCVMRHYLRRDFYKLLAGYGLSRDEYRIICRTYDKPALMPYIKLLAQDLAQDIANRQLDLPPVRIRARVDPSSGKVREIGVEHARQQCLDYIAVYSSMEALNRRIVLQQASSIKGRGQIMGVNMIRSWIRKDDAAANYAVKHNQRYSRQCKYFVKLDIKKCFPSARYEAFLRLFKRDCANSDILWLWETLLTSHRTGNYNGMMIGALPSCWAVQYMLSYAYRYLIQITRIRRGKPIRAVSHAIFFMDDMLLLGPNRKQLKAAVLQLERYMTDTMQLQLKPNWHIKQLSTPAELQELAAISEHDMRLKETAIDMMGYVIHGNGAVTIRRRIFRRLRRNLLRYHRLGHYNLKQAHRACSYKGYIIHTNSQKLRDMYKADEAMRAAALTISRASKRGNKQ